MRHEVIDFSMLDYRRLTAEERVVVKRWALARAHAERSRALREMLAGFAAFLRKLAVMTVQWCKARRTRRAQSIAAAELRSLSDHELKDIGVCRCEINALAFGGRA
jgi:uncharacterized protein YjiS (DUF1127 family)